MTRKKLTDEQVQAIIGLKTATWGTKFEIPLTDCPLKIQVYEKPMGDFKGFIFVWAYTTYKMFNTPDEAIAYAEHLLNRQYCWLPQNNGWIMSDEVYTFANNGANKVAEFMYLAEKNGFISYKQDWFNWDGISLNGYVEYSFFAGAGITIPADSPIWDAVQGLDI